MEYENCFEILNKYIEDYEFKIEEDLNHFVASNIDYRNIQYKEDFCMIVKKGEKQEVTANIGFPFPIKSRKLKKIKMSFRENHKIMFFLRGNPVRTRQNIDLLNELFSCSLVKYKEINTIKEFREIVTSICSKHQEFTYIDPYTFVGDSLIGTYFPSNFARSYSLKTSCIYSNSYEHLKFSICSKQYPDSKEDISDKLILIGDFLESHWEKTKNTIKKLTEKERDLIILGKNLIIRNINKKIYVYHLAKEDHLLRKQNINDYMNNILFPFLNPKREFPIRRNNSFENILINPFGSEEIKTIPMTILAKVIQKIMISKTIKKIIIIEGLPNNKFHKKWIEHFKEFLEKNRLMEKIVFKKYKSLSEIAKEILTNKIGFGITADTSIAHLFNYLGIKNITFFNFKRWDSFSLQSMSSDSPLGFCSYNEEQIPLILENDNEEIALAIVDYINYSNGKVKPVKEFVKIINKLENSKEWAKFNHELIELYEKITKKNLRWSKIMYHPKKLTQNLPKSSESRELILASWKINPLYKIWNKK